MKKIICSLFPMSSVNTVLDNLLEADFSGRAISVKASDAALAAKLAGDNGPLKGLSLSDSLKKLQSLSLPASLVQTYEDLTQKGMVLIAVSAAANTVDSVKETLSDSGGEEITVL